MIYLAYETFRRSTRPMAWMLEQGARLARSEANPLKNTLSMRAAATVCELPARALKDYGKQPYEVREPLGDQELFIAPEVVRSLPFADLLRFNVEDGRAKPKVLIAAALSGHHATLLMDTIEAFAQDYDTYITDWKDARQVPLSAGDFGFDEYAEYLMTFLEHL
ncbi:MAG TPA: polyhydroxyalkanoate depolymerase, partial [Novosphingobium sp.]|nr:polyhydroxyalkanoate depolymerase [Novosphingobium sp.]